MINSKEIRIVVRSIVGIPQSFSTGNSSLNTVVKDTGYFEYKSQIAENTIEQLLRETPDSVEQWLQYSEDKRSSFGCVFGHNTIYNKFFVVHHNSAQQDIFSDKFKACAHFIVLELECFKL